MGPALSARSPSAFGSDSTVWSITPSHFRRRPGAGWSVGGSARREGAHGKELCLRFSRTVRRLFLILSYPLPPLLSFSITKGIERHAGTSVSGSPCSHHPCEHRANWVSSESRLRCELPGEGLGDWTVRNHPALLWRCFGAAQGSRTPAARPSFGDRTGDGTAWLLHLAAMGSCPRFGPRATGGGVRSTVPPPPTTSKGTPRSEGSAGM